jgi:predicted aspartyl protease
MRLGETKVLARLYGPRGNLETEMLVDTGATLTTIAEEIARHLGVSIEEMVNARLADGTLRQFGMGEAKPELHGLRKTIGVLIVPGAQEPLLGLTALELFRLKVNPVTRELEPSDYKLYSASTPRFGVG